MKTTNQYIVNEIDKIFLKCCDHTSLRAISKKVQKLKIYILRYPMWNASRQAGYKLQGWGWGDLHLRRAIWSYGVKSKLKVEKSWAVLCDSYTCPLVHEAQEDYFASYLFLIYQLKFGGVIGCPNPLWQVDFVWSNVSQGYITQLYVNAPTSS